MTNIIIYPKSCKIDNEDDFKFIETLDRELSFRIQGSEFSQAFKNGFWDGQKHLLKNDLSFPYGLLQRVLDLYSKHNKQVEVIDQRDQQTSRQAIDIIPKLKELNRDPFPYQLEAVQTIVQKDIGIIRVATGGGKTIISALIAAHYGSRSILFVIGVDLLYQTHRFFSSVFNQKIGIVGDGLCDIQEINIVSIWSCGVALGQKNIIIDGDDEIKISADRYKDILDLLKTAKLIIYDEAHGVVADTFLEVAKYANPEVIYGMSATPHRDDNQDLIIESMIGRPLVNISASYLIEQGYLVRPTIKFITVPKMSKLPKNYQSISKEYIVENQVRNDLIIKGAERLTEQKFPTLVLFSSIKHGNILYEQLKDRVPCKMLNGASSLEERDIAKQEIESGKIKLILASKIFDIGVDVPCLSGLVIAQGGTSTVRNLQRIGRVIRKYGDIKKSAAIIDFYDEVKYFKNHSISRYQTYKTEPAFNVEFPKGK